MLPTFTEGRHAAEFVMSEANFHRSRDNIVIGNSQTIVPGAVLGRKAVVAGVVATPAAAAGNTASSGTIAMDATATTSAAKDGRYNGIAVTATTVRWEDPTGKEIGTSTHGSLFAKGGVRFTITAGGTPNVAGDSFYIEVAVDSSDVQYFEHNAAATDGTQDAVAIALYGTVTAADETMAISAITRDAEVNGNILTWKSGIAAGDKANGLQALAAQGIIVR